MPLLNHPQYSYKSLMHILSISDTFMPLLPIFFRDDPKSLKKVTWALTCWETH